MIQNLILSIGLSFAIGLNGARDNNHNFINNDTPNNVEYDDEENQITLSANELNNYTWNNLATIETTSSHVHWYGAILTYDDNVYTLNESDASQVFFEYSDYYIYLIYNSTQLNTVNEWIDYDFLLYKFYLVDANNEEVLNFSEDLYLVYDEDYNQIKNAIELDIQANTTQTSMGNSIINAIKSGLGLIGDLASQFLLGFSTLFWANNSLTPFGTFALVFLGISITMAVVSLVLNIIRNNTGA